MKTGQIIVKACIIIVMVFHAASYANLCPDCPGCQVQTGSPPNCACQNDSSKCSGCESCSGGSCSDDDSECDTDPNLPYCISAVCKECQSDPDCDGCAFCDLNNDCNSVVEVTIDALDPNYFCVGSTVTFTASTDKSGLDSEIKWDIPGGDPNTGQGSSVNATFSDPNTYTITAGCGDGEDEIEIVVVDVNMIEIKFGPGASDWDDVTGRTIVLLKGTEYQFRAISNPSDASWPSGAPTWSGIETGTDPTIDVTFGSTGTFELRASCCGVGEKEVTINVIAPEVDEVDYENGNFVLKKLESNGSGGYNVIDVPTPEYKRDPNGTGNPAFRSEPACWKFGADAQAQIKLWHADNLSYPAPDIVLRAETSGDGFNIGDWGDSTAKTWATDWSTTALCVSEMTIDSSIQLQDYTTQWNYKCTSGTNSWITIGPNYSSRLYVVVDTPLAPQAQPWVELLDHACDIADGAGSNVEAMDDIWSDFWDNSAKVYDSIAGLPFYTHGGSGAKREGTFALRHWLNEYGSTVTANCYDMAKAMVTYGNALGCDVEYKFVSKFGYVNCIKPIGCGWTNNPFYNSGYPINSNAIVDGNWSVLNGRSAFGDHAFATLSSNSKIYDASICQVDEDSNPDDPPHNAHNLDGDDTWNSNYKSKVIDDIPYTSTTLPIEYNFSVTTEFLDPRPYEN